MGLLTTGLQNCGEKIKIRRVGMFPICDKPGYQKANWNITSCCGVCMAVYQLEQAENISNKMYNQPVICRIQLKNTAYKTH